VQTTPVFQTSKAQSVASVIAYHTTTFLYLVVSSENLQERFQYLPALVLKVWSHSIKNFLCYGIVCPTTLLDLSYNTFLKSL